MTELQQSLPLGNVALYNPHLLSDKELSALFTVRRKLLERLLADLRRVSGTESLQHHLLIGHRGMGKTMLLRRLSLAIEEDPDLSRKWIAPLFPEEQYNVATLSDLWCNCIDALADTLGRHGEVDEAKGLDDAVESLPRDGEEERATGALAVLTRYAERSGNRLVLLIDNIDLIFQRTQKQQWALREVLSSERRLLLIGASATLIESTYKYDQAFYDFFQIHELGGLRLQETRDLLLHYADHWNTPRVREVVEKDRGRLLTFNTLTGGNPRTITLLYDVLTRCLEEDTRAVLEQMLDQCTPLYKARIEAFPGQAQQVMHGLAMSWDPISAGELAAELHMNVNAVSSQLNRLIKEGAVERVAYEPAAKTGFQIAERFFNIWYLMRASRRVRRRLAWLVEFLKLIYSQDELIEYTRNHVRRQLNSGSPPSLHQTEFSFVLSQAIEHPGLQNAFGAADLFAVSPEDDLRHRIGQLVDLSVVEDEPMTRAEYNKEMAEVRRQIYVSNVAPSEWSPEKTLKKLTGSASLTLGEKLHVASKLKNLTSDEILKLEEILDRQYQELKALFSSEKTARDNLLEAVQQGYMLNLGDLEGAKKAAEAFDSPWIVVAANRFRKPDVQELEAEFEKLLNSTTSAQPWVFWLRFAGRDAPRELIERAINKVYELSGTGTETFNSLGVILASHGLYKESETAFRNALKLKPDDAYTWSNLGNLLANSTDQFTPAEASLRKAIEISPELVEAWVNLGNLLRAGHRYKEAEKAYLRAIEIDPTSKHARYSMESFLTDPSSQVDQSRQKEDHAFLMKTRTHTSTDVKIFKYLLWLFGFRDYEITLAEFGLIGVNRDSGWLRAGTYLIQLGKYEDAAWMLRKAVEIQPEDAQAWHHLGVLLANHLDRVQEAEIALRKAIELGHESDAWNDLGVLLTRDLGRYQEAEEAFGQAIEIDANCAKAWSNLGILQAYHTDWQEKGAAVFRKAIDLDPDFAEPRICLGYLLYQKGQNLAEAEELTRTAVDIEPNKLHYRQTFANVLIRNNRWPEAVEQAKIFISRGSSESHQEHWPEIISFFREAVTAEKVKEAAQLLDDLGMAERWRPLREALEAVICGRRTYLRRIAPEVRQPAETILDQLVGSDWTGDT